MKPTLYLETTIPSYLAARTSRDLVVAAHQQITQEWWEKRLADFRVYISQLVLEECALGDTGAAKRRMALLKGLPVLDIDEKVLKLAQAMVTSGAIPGKVGADAIHVAAAAVNGLDFLLTWNCTHIHNAETVQDLTAVCLVHDYRCPVICTPEELMGEINL